MTAGDVHHIVITSFVSGGQDFALVVDDGAPLNFGGTGSLISFPSWSSTQVVRVGATPFTLSGLNDASTNGVYSWPGDILFFAMYSNDLTTG